MRVAVDVMGTLEGRKRSQIVAMILEFIKAGHEVVIWSSESTMARNACEKLNQILHVMDQNAPVLEWDRKLMRFDYPEEHHFDYAIEDDRQQGYLATKNFIWVDELPATGLACEALARTLK